MATTTQRMTVEEYLAWGERPENAESRDELVNGEVVPMPPPGRPHGIICFIIAGLFFDYFRHHGPGYATANDAGLIVAPDTVRGVDVAVFVGEVTEDDEKGYGVRMPVLCVEVVSPSDRPIELHKRVTQYHTAGVPIVWIVQPGDRAVFVHRKGQPVELFEGHDELTAEPELPGFSCRVSAFFTPPGRS